MEYNRRSIAVMIVRSHCFKVASCYPNGVLLVLIALLHSILHVNALLCPIFSALRQPDRPHRSIVEAPLPETVSASEVLLLLLIHAIIHGASGPATGSEANPYFA